ncbi:MAG TPA: murein biosynthesis integral membrane protein MurJ [Candidatus Acidoferrales bacterium]|nr:murein biosynthesis integral membrane protein MurJ [Candidatus Acidoferrales bacterium]
MTVKGQILRSASVIAVITIISRIFGYLRDQRIALLLGTSPAADSFVLAFRVPSMIRRMTAEGSLGASFIPLFSGQLRNASREEAWDFARKVFWDLAILLAIVAVLGIMFSRQVIGIYTLFGSQQVHWDLAVVLNRIIFPSIFFMGLAALAAAILNSLHVFGIPASASIFFNLTIIAFSFGFLYPPVLRLLPAGVRSPAAVLAIGVLVGTFFQFAIQIPSMLRSGMKFFPPGVTVSDPGVRHFGRLMGPSFFGMGVYQINLFIDTIFATSSRMPSGSITSLYVADRVMQLVLGSYAVAMSTVILPTMSHQLAAGQLEEMKRTFGFALRIVSFITIPAAVGLILLRKPIIQVLFQHGRFVAESTSLTANALLYYAVGLPAYAAIRLISPMYYSVKDTATPAKIGAYALVCNVILNAAFLLFAFRYLSNGSPALASSLAAYFNFVLLFVFFRKRYGGLGTRDLAGPIAKMAACATAMAAMSYAVLRLSGFAEIRHVAAQAGMLAAMIGASVGVYFGVAWLLRCEELAEFLSMLRRAEPGAQPAAELGI